jgi:hypothetical protein
MHVHQRLSCAGRLPRWAAYHCLDQLKSAEAVAWLLREESFQQQRVWQATVLSALMWATLFACMVVLA